MIQKIEIPDLDIDCSLSTRIEMLNTLPHIKASKINDKGINGHNVGLYFCNVPIDRITNLCSIDYKECENRWSFIKYDILHNCAYDCFKNRSEMFEIMNKPIDWDMLYKKSIVEQLPHINNYYTLINDLPKIDNIENLARFIAIVRPGKKALIEIVKKTNDWKSIDETIWIKPNEGYYYKHSHALSYALMITLVVNTLKYKGLANAED